MTAGPGAVGCERLSTMPVSRLEHGLAHRFGWVRLAASRPSTLRCPASRAGIQGDPSSGY